MRQPSSRTYLLTSGAITAAVLGSGLAQLLRAGRFPAGELRSLGFAAAAVLAAVGLSSRHTRETLDLARRMEQARFAGPADSRVVCLPAAPRSRAG